MMLEVARPRIFYVADVLIEKLCSILAAMPTQVAAASASIHSDS
jgi:hypothetical protein